MPSSSAGNIPEWVSEPSSKEKPPENASPDCYIYKVPSTLQVAGADKFKPCVISIGPYHANMENLVVTKNKKELFVQSLISRITTWPTSTSQGTTSTSSTSQGTTTSTSQGTTSTSQGTTRYYKLISGNYKLITNTSQGTTSTSQGTTSTSQGTTSTSQGTISTSSTSQGTTSTSQGTTTENPIHKMWNDISNLQAGFGEYYSEKPELNEDFVKMLIYDGCFILELLYRYQLNQMGADIFFQNNWIIPCLQLDLVLLENQIPYSVLTYLFELVPKIEKPVPNAQPNTTSKNFTGLRRRRGQGQLEQSSIEQQTPQMYSLKELVLNFFDPIIPTTDASDIDSSTTDRHLLDLLRNHLIHQDGTQVVVDMGNKETWEYTTCATELRNAGVTFKRKKANGLLDITFSDGIFEMPPFYFGKSWAILFSNLIALEQCRKDYHDKITSYAILMDNLINSSNDVKLLRDKGIIDGSKEEDETISKIVNSLCKEAVSETFYYDGVCSRLNAHRRRGLNQWRADFGRNYIHTPWAGISLAGAVFLLFLTVVQTVFSILSWILAVHGTYKTKTA